MLKISVIVTTYQRPSALHCVLDSLSKQSVQPYEVIIADDGSQSDTKDVVLSWQKKTFFSIIHSWQEDLGFRAAKARNLAAIMSTGDYLVFLDGDCVVFPDFIERHNKLAARKKMVIGSRILCSADFSELIESKKIYPTSWSYIKWLQAKFLKQVNRTYPLFKLPNTILRNLRGKRWKGVRTFNLGVWREDFFAVNGFDEQFQGWGHEDADLAIRLIRHGVLRKDGQFSLPVLHLWHKENDRSKLIKNVNLLQNTINSAQIKAKIGINESNS
jgi:glycosyltransferase involved in cell wall biosynthesis